jgi:hypothetical protein
VNGDVFPGGASNAAHRLIYAQDGGSHPAQSHETLAIISRPVGSGANGPGAIDAALAISTSKQNYGSPSAVQGQVDGINIWVRNGGANGVSSDTIAVEANVSSFGTTGAVFGFEMLSTNYSHASVQQWSVNIQGGVIDTLGGHAYGFVTNISKGAGLTGVVVQEAAPGATWTNFFQGNDNTGTTIFNVDRTGIVNTAGRITAKNLILNAPAATAWAFDATGCATVSVPNGGNVALPAGRGFIYLEESAAHNAAMYMMGGGAVNIVNGSQIGACFVASTKTPTAAHASVAFEASDATYRIYNNIGSTVTFTVAGVRIGTSA